MGSLTQELTRRVTQPPSPNSLAQEGAGRGGPVGPPPDITVPILSLPIDTVTGSTTADIGVTTDEANGTLYWVVTLSATPPTKAQVKAGQNSAGAAAAASGSQVISTTGAKTASATGLTADTAYTAHFMHEDAAANQSDVSTGNGLTTYTTEAQTYFTAMSVGPDATRKGLLNTLIKALKTAGVWTNLDLLYIMAAHDAQAARLNAKAPASFAATAVSSPTFTTDRGYAGNGTSSYLDTGLAPASASQYGLDSAHLGVWSRTNSNVNVVDIGAAGAASAGQSFIQARNGGNVVGRVNNNSGTGQINTATSDSSGHFVLRRSAASGTNAITVRRNGAGLAAGTQASSALTTRTLFIGAINSDGVAASFSAREYAAAHVGANLTDQNITDLYNALQTYMTAVGA